MNTKHYIIIIIVVIAIFALPLIIFPNAPYGGADSAAEEAISGKGYTPWFTPIWAPPSGEIESLFFALQAAVGAMIIGYFVGYERGKRVKKEIKEDTPPTSDG